MQAIQLALKHYIHLANVHFDSQLSLPKVSLNLHGKAAGQVQLKHNLMRFNETLYRENQTDFLQQTVGHETAHWVAYQIYGYVKPHGPEWRYIMQDVFHLSAQRVHHYDVRSVSGETFTYHCQCQTHELSIRRHRAVLRGKSRYTCRECGTLLIADEQTSTH